MEDKMTLTDGREITVYLKADQPAEIKSDDLALDTTGVYLRISRKKPKSMDESIYYKARRKYNFNILAENAWLLFNRAEEIFADSRMFLAPVNIVNGLAYTGTGGLQNPTLGVYLEWWLGGGAAVDAKGNLVGYISGSPLSGANCCMSFTPEGKMVKMAQHTPFSAVWGGFMKVNRYYTEAKQLYEAYTIEEVLVKLRGEGYRFRIVEIWHEAIQSVMLSEKNVLQRAYNALTKRFEKHLTTNKRLQLDSHRDRILAFFSQYTLMEQEMKPIHDKYLKELAALKQKLRGEGVFPEYIKRKGEIARDYRERKRCLSDFANNFMYEMLGNNPNEIRLENILKYARRQLKKQANDKI